ncbi:MAG: cobalamin biosynthesis protein CobG [Silicimonas sp.]|nr:cobalamin biosynthesis protein CobG [Silicimonas sp.]
MTDPLVKGWCPSAYRPMASGDGWLMRVRPRFGRLTARDAVRLCDLAIEFGNGMIDVTSRANLQIRGVSEDDHPDLLTRLLEEGLVDADPVLEARRNLVVTPFWQDGDLAHRLASALETRLGDLPELPGKMGFAIDTGAMPMLRDVSADFRFEGGGASPLMLCLDGADYGAIVNETNVMDTIVNVANWFVATGGAHAARMARHLRTQPLPVGFEVPRTVRGADKMRPGAVAMGRVYGVPFGQTTATDLRRLVELTGLRHLRVTPWRMLIAEGGSAFEDEAFITSPNDPLSRVVACPGAPACAQSSVETRKLARRLAGQKMAEVHVSGCAKGCASPRETEITIVGNGGRFDLVRQGKASDTPARTGLSETALEELIT